MLLIAEGLGVAALLFVILLAILSFALVRDDEVGIPTRKMGGKQMPQGQIIALNGEVGVQADTLMPGLHWRFCLFWKIEKVPVTYLEPGKIGIVEAIAGEPMTPGRLLADAIECNAYQDAKKFLQGIDGKKGMKGPQVAILRPGTYRINTAVFNITPKEVIKIMNGKVGVAIALDGKPLPSGFIIAPAPGSAPKKNEGNEGAVTDSQPKSFNFYQDGQAFLDQGGFRGPQLETLQPGEYYINPLLFDIDPHDVVDVPPGYVAVLRSNIGEKLEEASTTERPKEVSSTPDLRQPIHEEAEKLLITDKDKRGILRYPVAPGKYNLNPVAFTAYLVPTSAVTIDWASSGIETRTEHVSAPDSRRKQIDGEVAVGDKVAEFFKFSQLLVTSKDGFRLDVDVRMIIRIQPENAPFIIARFGSVSNLIEQIVHPLIDASFRNKAGEEKAIEFVQGRSKLQQQALEKAREEFVKYFVEAQNLLIAYIAVDQELLATQTKREIAFQQQEQYNQEAEAQKKRIAAEAQRARADKQGDVITAQLSIDIATNKAKALRKEAEGVRDSTKTRADGVAYEQRQVGEAIADAYRAQAKVLGPQATAIVKVVHEVGEKGIVVTPRVLVTGGGSDGQSGSMVTTLIASLLAGEKAWPSLESLDEGPGEDPGGEAPEDGSAKNNERTEVKAGAQGTA